MARRPLEPWNEEDPVVADLRPETIQGVGARLLDSRTFEELVYRECELDALWTLVDIAVAGRTREQVPASGLQQLQELFELAHEHVAQRAPRQAADVMFQAASLASSWS